MASQYIYALGRRKASTATLKLLSKGSGKHTLTHGETTVDLKQYFGGNDALYKNAISPLMVL
jgi:ribosomal protein S9